MLSYVENIPNILKVFEDLKPKSVLDIGPGLGKYGLLLREKYFEMQVDAGIDVPEDDIQIDCSEITPYFLKRPALWQIYNKVFDKNLFDWTDPQYDLILLIDVVEHYEKEQIKEWLAKVKSRVLISTPKNTVMYHRHLFGDPNHHKSQWVPQDFNMMKDYSTDLSFIFLK